MTRLFAPLVIAAALAACGEKPAPAPARAEVAAIPAVAPDPVPALASAAPAGVADLPPSAAVPAAAWPEPTPIDDADDPHDAPHVDRRLGRFVAPLGDQVAGRGFVLDGVPGDYTVYWPVREDSRHIWLIFDAASEHVATIDQGLREPEDGLGPGVTELDPTTLRGRRLRSFPIWESSFSEAQRQRGPGRRVSFVTPRYTYVVDTLTAVPWLFEGWQIREDDQDSEDDAP